jgi:drug/metabolite transporter (DMT)-like permease
MSCLTAVLVVCIRVFEGMEVAAAYEWVCISAVVSAIVFTSWPDHWQSLPAAGSAGAVLCAGVLPMFSSMPCRLLCQVRGKYGDDWERISRMSIIEDGPQGEK